MLDVICAGRSQWSLTADRPMRLLGGVIDIAVDLAKRRYRVGLATMLWSDAYGRKIHEKARALGIDTAGITFGSGVVLVEATTGQLASRVEPAIEIPPSWSSQVLLLSGLTPVVAHSASACRAARAARKAGSIVVLDVNAQWQLWAGHDPRAMRMLLREADVVHCSSEDMFVLDLDVAGLRRATRTNATLVMSTAKGVAVSSGDGDFIALPRTRDAITSSICAELARDRSGNPFERALVSTGGARDRV